MGTRTSDVVALTATPAACLITFIATPEITIDNFESFTYLETWANMRMKYRMKGQSSGSFLPNVQQSLGDLGRHPIVSSSKVHIPQQKLPMSCWKTYSLVYNDCQSTP